MKPFGRTNALVATLLAIGGCGSEVQGGRETAEPTSAEEQVGTPAETLIDPSIAPAVAGEGGWNYSRTAEADLDADGTPERIVLTARVEMYEGRPAWDDGQPWQVYVEELDGTRTHVYGRRLQLGTLQLRLTSADAPAILLIEHLPDQLAIHEITYTGPGEFRATTPFSRSVDPRGETAGPQFD